MNLGRNCYCYNESCNQKEWEKQGRKGKRQWTVVSSFTTDGNPPICEYCKKPMTITANIGIDGDFY